ncbi:MAG: response regulator [Desulfoferrobacter sp.]
MPDQGRADPYINIDEREMDDSNVREFLYGVADLEKAIAENPALRLQAALLLKKEIMNSSTPSKMECAAAAEQTGTPRLLLIDDEENVLEIIKDMLLLEDYEVVAERDARRAQDLIRNERFDLVLTDLGMPVISGWEIAEEVKSRNHTTPVILFTGWGAQYEEESFTDRCVDCVLSKPLGIVDLLSAVKNVLRSRNEKSEH